jgi:putative ABC transport system ATP-binding protein
MEIELQNIVPVPLKDRLLQRSSDVWNKNISFSSKEWIKIKAPSGTGKTTFIHSIYKLRTDYSGNILWNQKNINSIRNDELAIFRKEKLSIIFQDLRLFSNLTAKENIELKRVLQKPIHEESKIDEMAAKLGITSILNQQAGLCSYGEQQRIAIIRSLMQPFELLLMDEPFSHLDKDNTVKCAALIAEECAKQNAGFVVTDLDDDDHFNYSKKINL